VSTHFNPADLLNAADLRRFVDTIWDQSIVPELCNYVRIPNKSPLFDPDWERHGFMESAVQLLAGWCRRQPIAGMKVEIARLPGRTPVIFVEVPGTGDTVLLYGHLDKQPEFTGWHEGLSPWEPVIRDGRLYGRGAADDGYAVFSSLTAIAALEAQHVPHARCVVLIEACEESGSPDLPAHVEASRRASAHRVWSCVWMPKPEITNGCGSRLRCEGTSSARWIFRC
jgi:acetylornithine deacetylase/succinyl-diaminopimelate desuccinylase-like protein